MTDIVIIAPVLRRAHNAQPLADSAAAATRYPYRLLFVCSPGDHAQIAACEGTGADVLIASWQPGRGDFARKINLAYRSSTEPFIFQAADDVTFEPRWDVEAMTVAETLAVGVVGTNDLGNDAVMRGTHSTHSLIRRAYIADHGGSLDGPGVVFHEGYGHQWSDTELVELAKARGEWGFAARSIVRHHHPFWDRAVSMDATYRKGLATGATDRRLYNQRSKAWTGRS